MSKRLYLEAARRIADGRNRCACFAIDDAAEEMHSAERAEFTALFQPIGAEGHDFLRLTWLQLKAESEESPAAIHRRVMALCLMAAIVGSTPKTGATEKT